MMPRDVLTWSQLRDITSTALAADSCAGWSVCIYNPDLDPGHDGASNIISYLTHAITTADRRLTNSTPDPGTLLCADRRRPRCGRPGRAPGRCPPARQHCLSTAIGGNRDCQDLDRRHPHR
jgi:hypothetical protein